MSTVSGGSPVTSSAAPPTSTIATPASREEIYACIIELSSPETREAALLELSKKREVVSDLAPMLWHSFGTMAALLQVSNSNKYFLRPNKYFSQEIINIYPAINPPVLTAHQSNRVCNALALLQCVASHPDTRYGELFALSLP